MERYLKLAVVLLAIAFGACFFLRGEKAKAQSDGLTAGMRYKSIKVLNDMPADQMGKVMNMISASLGVKCGFCHASNDGDYEKEGLEHKDTARKMMKMVFELNKTQFNGRPEINCNTCHHGISHPQPSIPLVTAGLTEQKPKQPATKPTVDQIIARFTDALGGKAKLDAAPSRIIKAQRHEPDGKTFEPETIWLSDDSYRSDIAYGKYIVTEIYDGLTARKFGDREEIPLKHDEAEQIRREGELFYPSKIRSVYPKMEYRALEWINGREVYVITATTAASTRERLFFDVLTGLLVRRTASSPTIFGNFVYQVDYADYKEFTGVKIPTTVNYAVPNITWMRKVLEVKSSPVADSIFDAPGGKN